MSRTVSRIALILTLALLFLLPSAALADLEGLEGSGTEGEPYLISSKEDLLVLADAVNKGNTLQGVHFLQTEDIDLKCNGDAPWPVIGHVVGNTPHPFDGVYDGGNFKISGLFVGTTDEDGDPVGTQNEDAGLFGHVGEKGVIQRVHVVDCGVYSKSLYVGGIAGRNEGLVEYCSSYATDPDASSGVVKGSWQYVGGIVGYNFGKISYCYSNCDVLGAQKAGGITGGQNGGTVVNCYFRGYVYADDITRAYAGGIAGENDGDSTIDNCYSDCTVEGKNNNEYCGAISGSNDTGSSVENCFWEDSDGTGLPGIGSGMGDVENVEKRTEEEFTSGQVAWELSQGTDGSGWGQNLHTDSTNSAERDNHPHFTDMQDKHDDTTPVYRVRLKLHADSDEFDEIYFVDPYINLSNPATDVDLPNLVDKGYSSDARWYLVKMGENDESFEFILGADNLPVVFDGDVTDHDVDSIAGEHVRFAGVQDMITVETTYNPAAQTFDPNLDQYMNYAAWGPSSAEGLFEYEIITDNDRLGAEFATDGRMLTIPAGAEVGEYDLTVNAHEKKPYFTTFSIARYAYYSDYGYDDVILNVKVVIKPATPELSVIASEITYGQTLSDSVLDGSTASVGENKVDGSFVWQPVNAGTLIPIVKNGGLPVHFTPTDNNHYNDVTITAPLVVNPKPLNVTAMVATNRDYEPGNVIVEVKGGELDQSEIVTRDGKLDEVDLITHVKDGIMEDADAGVDKPLLAVVNALIGKDADNYKLMEPPGVYVTIYKIDPIVDPAPKAKALYYTGGQQALVTPGVTSGGTLVYSLSEDGPYSDSIPTGLAEGTYTVWYKVVGDKNYNDLPAQSVDVTIVPSPLADVPKTGDSTNLMLWAALMLLSASALCLVGSKSRRTDN